MSQRYFTAGTSDGGGIGDGIRIAVDSTKVYNRLLIRHTAAN
jgi:hypothetical protein